MLDRRELGLAVAAADGEKPGIAVLGAELDTAHVVLKQVYCGKLEGLLGRRWPEVGELLKQRDRR